MKYFLLVFCLVLSSCFSEDEAVGQTTSPNISSVLPSSSSIEPEPSILDCPLEDIAEYPVSIPNPWTVPDERPPDGWVGALLKLSIEELSFGKQGGVRCVAASQAFLSASGSLTDCRSESIIVSDSINKPPTFINVNRFKREVCPWLIATRLDDGRTLHISVNQNETGKEREMRILVSIGNSGRSLTITQSAD